MEGSVTTRGRNFTSEPKAGRKKKQRPPPPPPPLPRLKRVYHCFSAHAGCVIRRVDSCGVVVVGGGGRWVKEALQSHGPMGIYRSMSRVSRFGGGIAQWLERRTRD